MARPLGVHWLFYAVDTSIPWPTDETTVAFLGEELILRPTGPEGQAPDIRVKLKDDMEKVDGTRLILRFLSMLCWWEQKPAQIDLGALSNVPYRFNIHCLPPPQCPGFVLPAACQYPADAKSRLAIGLHREAISVNNVFYKFLGFYKIIDCCFDNDEKKARAWINQAATSLNDSKADRRVEYHASMGRTNIANHLYSKCRCAIAHASLGKNTNPDDPVDLRAIQSELPLMRALAVKLVESELGLPHMLTFTKSRT